MYVVIKQFRDKYTKEVYKAGTLLDIDKERAAEILERGPYIEEQKDQTQKRTRKAEK